MAPRNKFYAVCTGRTPGIYTSWPDCQKQVIGYPNAIFKGFATKEDAENFINHNLPNHNQMNILPIESSVSIYVDGSYQSGRYSWAFAVYSLDGKLTHQANGIGNDKEAAKMNNVAGELAGALEAIQWAEKNDIRPITIYHDYSGLAHWASGYWKANNKFTIAYATFVSPKLDWITFRKVAGHTGVDGNEVVDRLAKEALGLIP